ncbi:MAG: RNA methyltransferase [Gemmatimonadota bacterium]|nr:RNA methyltransferase [Gemmatimonadota bacterium]
MPSRSERKVWRSLRKRKGRDATGWFLTEGVKLVREVVAAGPGGEAVLLEQGRADEEPLRTLRSDAERAGWRVEDVERWVIDEIADTKTPQPVIAIAHIPRWTWDDVGAGHLVLLDGVQDPGNVGTLIRTAIGLGAAGVAVLDGSADPWGPKTFRASAGASLIAPTFAADRHSTIDELSRRQIPIWIAGADGESVDRGGEGGRSVAIALGSEAHGVSAAIEAAGTRRVAVEMRAGVDSLNVASAGAILLDRIMNSTALDRDLGDRRQTGGTAGNGD